MAPNLSPAPGVFPTPATIQKVQYMAWQSVWLHLLAWFPFLQRMLFKGTHLFGKGCPQKKQTFSTGYPEKYVPPFSQRLPNTKNLLFQRFYHSTSPQKNLVTEPKQLQEKSI